MVKTVGKNPFFCREQYAYFKNSLSKENLIIAFSKFTLMKLHYCDSLPCLC